MKLIIGIIIIAITAIGWMISESDKISFLQKIIAPSYLSALETLKTIHEKSFALNEGDEGFKPLAKIINKLMKRENEFVITYIKTKDYGTIWLDTSGGGQVSKPYIDLEVGLQGEAPIFEEIYDINEEAKLVLFPKVTLWGAIIFWLGILAEISLLLYDFFSKK